MTSSAGFALALSSAFAVPAAATSFLTASVPGAAAAFGASSAFVWSAWSFAAISAGFTSDVASAALTSTSLSSEDAASAALSAISVFVSRKDAKLYVRQTFAPLFDVPVTIAPSDRPLGTHIFTAEADKNDANVLRWSVVTLPSNRSAERRDDDERASRRRKIAGAAEIAKPAPEPDSPTEALDRLAIPADVMARITEALSTGGSIIVSDQGIAAGETGEGTDFIVSLR